MKVSVMIEELLSRRIEVDIPSDVEDVNQYALDKVKMDYKNSLIVLDADDFSGITTMYIEDENSDM
ncbi:MAG: DpnD/PcfM family protein [Longicatena sp.]|nr:DpnD/PcfM family protein [Longicatena sp.]